MNESMIKMDGKKTMKQDDTPSIVPREKEGGKNFETNRSDIKEKILSVIKEDPLDNLTNNKSELPVDLKKSLDKSLDTILLEEQKNFSKQREDKGSCCKRLCAGIRDIFKKKKRVQHPEEN